MEPPATLSRDSPSALPRTESLRAKTEKVSGSVGGLQAVSATHHHQVPPHGGSRDAYVVNPYSAA